MQFLIFARIIRVLPKCSNITFIIYFPQSLRNSLRFIFSARPLHVINSAMVKKLRYREGSFHCEFKFELRRCDVLRNLIWSKIRWDKPAPYYSLIARLVPHDIQISKIESFRPARIKDTYVNIAEIYLLITNSIIIFIVIDCQHGNRFPVIICSLITQVCSVWTSISI